MHVCQLVADRLPEVYTPPRVGLIVEGFAVPHAHVHVFPAYEGLEATIAHKPAQPTNEELEAVAQRLEF